MTRTLSAFRSLAATLALSAMVLRALLPAGWMPNTEGVPGTALIICSIDGVRHVPHHPGKPDVDHGMACPFAGMAHLARAQVSAAVLQPTRVVEIATRSELQLFVSNHLALEHWARGPPASV